jgi:hypothetical protein
MSTGSRSFLATSWSIFLLVVVFVGILHLPGNFAAEMVCDAADGSCTSSTTDGDFQVTIQNDSKYRADVYWDDGRFGSIVTTLEVDEVQKLNVYEGHVLFVTRHGVRENLFVGDEPVTFSIVSPTVLTIPSTAAPSNNPCQDRYGICEDEAARGSCTETPGWMIVHCCQACKPYIDSSRLIDPKVRCSQDHLNMTDPVWKPGDLNKLFHEWYVQVNNCPDCEKDPLFSVTHHHQHPTTPIVTGLHRRTTNSSHLEYGQVLTETPTALPKPVLFQSDHGSSPLIRFFHKTKQRR